MSEIPDREVLAQLLALLAHDLRNPLSALQSNCSYVRASTGPLGAEEIEAIDDALVSCDSLLFVIDSVDLLSQVLAGHGPRPQEPVRWGEVIADVAARHRALAKSHGVVLQGNGLRNEGSVEVMANREMLVRALGYVLRNSIQHTRSGGSVTIGLQHEGGRGRVVVADSGTPLAPEYFEEAFSASGQILAKNRAGARYGRGLGLYCARVAVAYAGASLRVVDPLPETSQALELSAPLRRT